MIRNWFWDQYKRIKNIWKYTNSFIEFLTALQNTNSHGYKIVDIKEKPWEECRYFRIWIFQPVYFYAFFFFLSVNWNSEKRKPAEYCILYIKSIETTHCAHFPLFDCDFFLFRQNMLFQFSVGCMLEKMADNTWLPLRTLGENLLNSNFI